MSNISTSIYDMAYFGTFMACIILYLMSHASTSVTKYFLFLPMQDLISDKTR